MYRERLVRREKRQRAAALQNFAEFHAAFASVSIRGLLESCSHPATRDWQACNTKKWNRSNCRITRHQFFNSRKLAQFASGLFSSVSSGAEISGRYTVNFPCATAAMSAAQLPQL